MQLNKCGILSHLIFWSTFSLVQPYFDYCKVVVWGSCNKEAFLKNFNAFQIGRLDYVFG